jgi:hypothetical protein
MDGSRFPELSGFGNQRQTFSPKTRTRYTNIVPEVLDMSRAASTVPLQSIPTDSFAMRARPSFSAALSAPSADMTELAIGKGDRNLAGGANAPVVTVNSTQRYLKYFKMVKLGLSPQSVAAKMLSDGMVNSLEDGLKASRTFTTILYYSMY